MTRQADPQPEKGKDSAAPGHNKDEHGRPAKPEKKVEPQPLDGETHAANIREAAKAPHENKKGVLKKGQKLRDGTVVNTDLAVEYKQTPEGKIVVGGIYDGKRL